MPVEILTHTADLRIKVTAPDLPELFVESLRGMTEASEPLWRADSETIREISIVSPDRNALLVDFLSEALRLGDTNNEAYTDVVFDELTDTSLKCRLIGRSIERLSLEIKAVTYHELDIKHSNEQWETNIVFDI